MQRVLWRLLSFLGVLVSGHDFSCQVPKYFLQFNIAYILVEIFTVIFTFTLNLLDVNPQEYMNALDEVKGFIISILPET